MQSIKPNPILCGRATLLAAACLVTPLHAAEPDPGAAAAEHELAERRLAIEEAQELLRKGDECYRAERFADAVQAYAGARGLIPDAPVSTELRAAATERLVTASIAQAKDLSRRGDIDAAKAAIDKVLDPAVAPKHRAALATRAELDDPVRTNPALNAAHAKNVDEVRRLLYTAQGAYHLGAYDQATESYQAVLKIDSTNAAARRGLEEVAAAKSAYADAAHDQTRAELLGQVDAAWELPVNPAEVVAPGAAGEGPDVLDPSTMTLAARLDNLIVPKIALDQATLEEAIDFLRAQTVGGEGSAGAVNFTINLGPQDSEQSKQIRARKFDLRLTNVPLRQAVKYITDATGTAFSTDDFSVVIRPVGSNSEELVSRTYRVPPDFLTSLNASAGAGGGEASDNPFEENSGASQGLLTKRLTVQEALSKQGVAFPEGALANYSPSNNTLRVVNTPGNQDFIAQIIDTMTQTEPVMVAVRVTMIRTQQTNLKELGFDWLVSPFGADGTGESNLFLGGGTTGNGTARTSGDFVSPVNFTDIPGVPAAPGVAATNLVTGGLRSGDSAIDGQGIDGVIGATRGAQQSSVAPGVLSLTGLFSDAQVQMIMRGLDRKKGVDLMSKPSTVTRSGQSATVSSVREFRYATEYEPPELPNAVGEGVGTTPVTPATPTAFETREVGVKLEVLPVADSDKRYIDVTLSPELTEFDGFINYGSPITAAQVNALGQSQQVVVTDNSILMPVFSKQATNTQLTVLDGSTIAIGGLMSDTIQTVDDKVPLLGEMPVVGRLFSSRASQPTTYAVVFLVQVELLDPTGRPYRER